MIAVRQVGIAVAGPGGQLIRRKMPYTARFSVTTSNSIEADELRRSCHFVSEQASG
jgi:hypothetical protein